MADSEDEITQALNFWHKKRFSNEVQRSLRLAYLFSPEWEELMNGLWTVYDQLEQRRMKSQTPRLKWQDEVEEQRKSESSLKERTYKPIQERLWPMRPLWVHLAAYQGRPDRHARTSHSGWAYTLDAWEETRRLIQDDPSFRKSLSPVQQRSFELLLSWRQATYCDHELLDAAFGTMERGRSLKSDVDPTAKYWLRRVDEAVATDTSLYHARLFKHFLLEFHPMPWQPFVSHFTLFDLQESRYRASCAAVVQKLSHAALNPASPAPSERYPQVVQNDTDTERLTGHQTGRKPYYLWDSRVQKTVVVGELPVCPDYICISHTWGRWRPKDRTSTEVPGIPWLVPENTLHDVRDLPGQLVLLNHQYIWIDLFCIPQDKSERADLEIANQTSIFKGSSHCIAWMNDVDSWDGVCKALDWISLRSLSVLSHRHAEIISERMPEATAAVQTPIELLTRKPAQGVANSTEPYKVSSGEPAGWLSSLWTLQECVLCPDIELYSRNWVRLEDRRGSPISLRALMVFLRETWDHCWLDGPIETPFFSPEDHYRAIRRHPERTRRQTLEQWQFPSTVEELFYLCMVTRLDNVLTSGSPTTVLTNSNFRQCSRSRAPAIMSALGVTEWYLKSPPVEREHQLVFKTYPLAFLREAARKFGAIFYECSSNRMPRGRSVQELRHILVRGAREGTMLPVSKTLGWFSRITGSVEHTYIDRQDDQSVSTWTINEDGSVSMTSVGIALTSKDDAQPQKIAGFVNCATTQIDEKGRVVMAMEGVTDMLEALRGLTIGSRVIYAVALYHDLGRLHGVLLEMLPISVFGKHYLNKIGSFLMEWTALPPTTKVDWKVL